MSTMLSQFGFSSGTSSPLQTNIETATLSEVNWVM